MECIEAVDNFGSEGFEINLHHRGGFFMKATGRISDINEEGNISRQAKFGYQYLNDPERIKKPLLKKNGKFEEITFDQAYQIIIDKIKGVNPDDNAFFAGARLTNEEIYMIQKLARAGVKTNNLNCFHYMGRGIGYGFNAAANVPFNQIKNASRIFILGSTLNMDHPLVNHLIFSAKSRYGVPVELVTTDKNSLLAHKVDKVHFIKSYYHFIKAVNYYLLSSELQNQLFINDRSIDYKEYRKNILAEDFDELFEKSGVCCIDELVQFATGFNNQMNAVLVFSEKEHSSNVSFELINLAIITGKLGKTAQGIVALKEKNNSQGVIDMGGCHKVAPGFQPYSDPSVVEKLGKKWGVNLPEYGTSSYKLLLENRLKNIFIFGEDPIGCAINRQEVEKWFSSIDFLMVQDYFITETAQKADLILPASLPIEIGGSFTNTQKHILTFEKQIESAIEITAPQQLIALMSRIGLNGLTDSDSALSEMFSLLPEPVDPETRKYLLQYTGRDNYNRMFNHGCDIVNKRFDEEFEKAF